MDQTSKAAYKDCCHLFEVISDKEFIALLDISKTQQDILFMRWHQQLDFDIISKKLFISGDLAQKQYNESLVIVKKQLADFVQRTNNTIGQDKLIALLQQEIHDLKIKLELTGYNKEHVDYSQIFINDVEGFSVRAMNCFRMVDIRTVKDLFETPKHVFMAIPNVGKNTLTEVQEIMYKKYQFRLWDYNPNKK